MASSQPSDYSRLAELLSYPEEETLATALEWVEAWTGVHPRPAALIRGWYEAVAEYELWQLQELYTRTFDLNPCCSLDIGYYLFGEDYQRGAFMAGVREQLDLVGIAADQELPDHLPHILRWLEKVYGSEDHVEMVAECLLPVLVKMDQAFASQEKPDDSKPHSTNPYRALLRALGLVLDADIEALGIVLDEPVPATTGAI